LGGRNLVNIKSKMNPAVFIQGQKTLQTLGTKLGDFQTQYPNCYLKNNNGVEARNSNFELVAGEEYVLVEINLPGI
jgi:hypothetical protein